MSFQTHQPESDLFLPVPNDGTKWDPMTINTHAELVSIPEAKITIFLYLRCLPAFNLSQGGICIMQGLDNPANESGISYLDYRETMPWPEIGMKTFTTANGLKLEFLEPGHKLRISYRSPDATTTLDVVQTAVTPLLARGHIIPGEDRGSDPANTPGGTEQFMHAEGELVLHGQRYIIDSFDCRDRSWNQVRSETANIAGVPPICWTPMHFGDHLTFNQVSFEHERTDPLWKGLFSVPESQLTHHFAWIRVNGKMRKITQVDRDVQKYHPTLLVPIKQTISAIDETGQRFRFEGEAIAAGAIPAWTNATLRQIMYRWTNTETGEIAVNSGQEIWLDNRYARHALRRAAAAYQS